MTRAEDILTRKLAAQLQVSRKLLDNSKYNLVNKLNAVELPPIKFALLDDLTHYNPYIYCISLDKLSYKEMMCEDKLKRLPVWEQWLEFEDYINVGQSNCNSMAVCLKGTLWMCEKVSLDITGVFYGGIIVPLNPAKEVITSKGVEKIKERWLFEPFDNWLKRLCS